MKGRCLTAALVAGLLWALPASALMIRYDLQRLSTGSDKIVIGNVVDTESKYLVPGRAIYTFVTIDVEEVLKGEISGNELTLRVPGGTVGEETMVVEHEPDFMIGEKVLVFAARQVDGQDVLYNAENGKYTIEDGIVVEKGVPLEGYILAIRAYLDDGHDQEQGD